jgi:hypothetical protein
VRDGLVLPGERVGASEARRASVSADGAKWWIAGLPVKELVRLDTGAKLLRLLAREAGGRIARLLLGTELLDDFLFGLGSTISGVPTITQASLSVCLRLFGGLAGSAGADEGLSCS